MNNDAANAARRSIRRHQIAGLIVVGLLVGSVGSWAATTSISGAVIAPGSLVVDSDVKKVQHPTGGVVGEILARDGDHVKAGDVVLRLDDTVTRASLAIVSKGLTELIARKSRLEAERDAADTISVPDELATRLDDVAVKHVVQGEQRLFELRKTSRTGQKERLKQRLEQIQQEIVGLTVQAEAKSDEIDLVGRELEGARRLYAKNLFPITKMTNLEREATRLKGERGKLIAAIAQTKARATETELEILQIDRDLGSEVARELREVDAKIGEFVERKIAAEDQLSRIDIRAPQSGHVHQSTVHTVGGVIGPGEPLMLIIPDADRLTVEARVAPQDIDQLHVGQEAMLRFSAFNQRTTPEISATVTRLSADTTTDEKTGLSYYTIRLAMADAEVARLGDNALVPGMPVEVFVKTEDRKVLSYLVKPLADQVARAFREQ
jgi:HlyD family secretion protein